MTLRTVCKLTPKPTEEHPLRARVVTDTAHAYFNTAEEARQFLDHPGSLPMMSSLYLSWVEHMEGGPAVDL